MKSSWSKAVFWSMTICALSLPVVSGNLAFAQDPAVPSAAAQDEVFSGPQVGESLPTFVFRETLGDGAGTDVDLVAKTGDGALLLIFVHDVNRQSISMTRILSRYAQKRSADGLTTGVIFLADDPTVAEETVQRIRHALTPGVATGVSLEGREGPGSYGLNRNVMLTILVAKQGVVTGNFALVQPSLQADLPKMLESIVGTIGGTVPKLEELEGMESMMANRTSESERPNLRPLLTPLIRKSATVEEVDKAATAVEEQAAQNDAIRREVGRIARTIVDSGKLESYGTARAREYLQKWADQYGSAAKSEKARGDDRPPPESPR